MNVIAIQFRKLPGGSVDFYFESDDGWRKIENVVDGRVTIHSMSEAKLQRAERVDDGG